MSNTNTNLQTQTSNALHNAIMEASGKDRPPMLALDQLNAEAKAIQIILIGIDNDIYSIVDACPNACEMWKAIERLKQGELINVQDLETNLYWKTQDKVSMQIPDWMITKEMKHTEHYRMYAKVFGLDVPLTQSQSTESTQGIHSTPSAPRSPNPKMDAAESSAPKWSTVIRFCLPKRRSTRLTPPAPVPTADKAYEMILQDTLQIEKMVEGPENVVDDSSIPRNDELNILGTRLEPRSDKESLEVEITNDEEVEITNVVIPVNVNEEEEEITDEVYELKRREKGKILEESRSIPFPTPIRSPKIHTDLMKFENLQVPQTTCRPSVVRQRIRRSSDDANLEGRMWQSGRSNQEQVDDYDFWTDSYASDDDEILMKQVPQDIIEEVSLTIDEAKLKKMADEMLRQRCTLGDEHQYHIDQMKNFLKSDIVWESRKEILVSPHPRKTSPLVQSCQRDPEAPTLSLINQDLLYLKKGSSRPEKIVLSLHKFPTIIFNDDDIEERTSRWVPEYAETGVEKNKMFSIIYEPVHGIIYKNSLKEKRVMRHSEIHKFCDATLNRVLEGLKSYNNDVKYGYEQRELTADEVEYLKLFEKEIEVSLKYRNQMRRWEIYVNGRPLGPRRERPE
ncbi:hypothetical protein Tco_1393250 [Tanacetum coccineum]